MAKECAQSTGKLSSGGLSSHNVVRITDCARFGLKCVEEPENPKTTAKINFDNVVSPTFCVYRIHLH